MSSFVRYMLKYKEENDKLGEVARMIHNDKNINRKWSHRQLSYYFDGINADQEIFDIINEMARNYQLALEIRKWEARPGWT